jgi:epoxide hydrolase 4
MPAATLPANLEHHSADIFHPGGEGGLRMHYVTAGDGEPVLFLHGFPESWYSWRHQLEHFAGRFRCVAPDLRGYGDTENAGPYDTTTLQRDVLGLIDRLGGGPVHVVAHDWGGAIAWLLAIDHPEAVKSLAVLNIPHPKRMQEGIRRPRQLARSWYIFFFQLPWLPEKFLAANGYRGLARTIIRSCAPGTFTRDDIKHMLASWRASGLGGGVNWYRAVLRKPRRLPDPVPVIEVPVTLIWGENDSALGVELTHGTDRYASDLEVHYLPGVSHWVQQEAPERVNELLERHFARAGA